MRMARPLKTVTEPRGWTGPPSASMACWMPWATISPSSRAPTSPRSRQASKCLRTSGSATAGRPAPARSGSRASRRAASGCPVVIVFTYSGASASADADAGEEQGDAGHQAGPDGQVAAGPGAERLTLDGRLGGGGVEHLQLGGAGRAGVAGGPEAVLAGSGPARDRQCAAEALALGVLVDVHDDRLAVQRGGRSPGGAVITVDGDRVAGLDHAVVHVEGVRFGRVGVSDPDALGPDEAAVTAGAHDVPTLRGTFGDPHPLAELSSAVGPVGGDHPAVELDGDARARRAAAAGDLDEVARLDGAGSDVEARVEHLDEDRAEAAAAAVRAHPVLAGVGRVGDLDEVDEATLAVGPVGIDLDAVQVDTDERPAVAALAEGIDLLAGPDGLGVHVERPGLAPGGQGGRGGEDEGGGRQGHYRGGYPSHAALFSCGDDGRDRALRLGRSLGGGLKDGLARHQRARLVQLGGAAATSADGHQVQAADDDQ